MMVAERQSSIDIDVAERLYSNVTVADPNDNEQHPTKDKAKSLYHGVFLVFNHDVTAFVYIKLYVCKVVKSVWSVYTVFT